MCVDIYRHLHYIYVYNINNTVLLIIIIYNKDYVFLICKHMNIPSILYETIYVLKNGKNRVLNLKNNYSFLK